MNINQLFPKSDVFLNKLLRKHVEAVKIVVTHFLISLEKIPTKKVGQIFTNHKARKITL